MKTTTVTNPCKQIVLMEIGDILVYHQPGLGQVISNKDDSYYVSGEMLLVLGFSERNLLDAIEVPRVNSQERLDDKEEPVVFIEVLRLKDLSRNSWHPYAAKRHLKKLEEENKE